MDVIPSQPGGYMTDEAKVLYALSKITGEGFATKWGNVKGDKIDQTRVVSSWNDFVVKMKWVCDDLNDRAMALYDLERLKQGSSDAPEFFARFETLMQRAELHLDEDSDILVHWLEVKLNRRLTSRIYGTNLMPVMYRDWKTLAELLDVQQQRLDGIIHEQNASRPTP